MRHRDTLANAAVSQNPIAGRDQENSAMATLSSYAIAIVRYAITLLMSLGAINLSKAEHADGFFPFTGCLVEDCGLYVKRAG